MSDTGTPIRTGSLATAFLILAGVAAQGCQALAARPDGTVPPTADPTPAPSIPGLPIGPITADTYAWYWNDLTISVSVPAGWIGHSYWGLTTPELSWGWAGNPALIRVWTDACAPGATLQRLDGTVAGLVAMLDAQPGTDASVTDIVIDGRPAKRVDLVQSPGIDDRAGCRHGAGGPLQVWADPGETKKYSFAPGVSGFVQAVDVAGRLVVFFSTRDPSAPAADIAELDAIMATIKIVDTAPSPAP